MFNPIYFQERGLLRIFNIDACTFIKYMFVIEGNYHKSNPYHNAMHGADVMQSAHVLLGCPVIEVSFLTFKSDFFDNPKFSLLKIGVPLLTHPILASVYRSRGPSCTYSGSYS